MLKRMRARNILYFPLILTVLVLFVEQMGRPVAQTQVGPFQCPKALVVLCGWPRVRSIVVLQDEINEARKAIPSFDVVPIVSKQTNILARMWDVSHINIVTQYLSKMDASMALPNAAKAVGAAGMGRALKLFVERPQENRIGEIHDLMDLLDLTRRQGDPEAARRGLDQITAETQEGRAAYDIGFAIAEAGHTLARWSENRDARRHFERARRFARTQPLRDSDGFDTRFMILIHVVQRAWESGFLALARETLAEAETLQASAYPGREDLKGAIRLFRDKFEN